MLYAAFHVIHSQQLSPSQPMLASLASPQLTPTPCSISSCPQSSRCGSPTSPHRHTARGVNGHPLSLSFLLRGLFNGRAGALTLPGQNFTIVPATDKVKVRAAKAHDPHHKTHRDRLADQLGSCPVSRCW